MPPAAHRAGGRIMPEFVASDRKLASRKYHTVEVTDDGAKAKHQTLRR